MTPQNRIEQYLAAIKAAWTGETPLPEYPSEPAWRIESFLAAILSAVKGDSPVLSCPDPVWDIEAFGRAIYDALTGASPAWPCPVPTNNTEMILYAIYKAVSDGGEEATPLPAWNIEHWLLDVYEAAKEGGDTKATVAGVAPITLSDAISAAIISLKQYGLVTQPPKVYYDSLTQYGLCVQNGTPTPDTSVDIMCNNGALKMLNLANMAESNLDIGYYLNNSGVRTASAPNFYTLGFVPVKPSTTYTMKTSASLNYYNIMEYDSAQAFLNRTLWGSSGSPAGDTTTFTTRSDTAYIRFGSNMNGNTLTYADIAAVTWMLTEGATAQDYVPYGQLSVVGTPEVLTVSMKNLYDASTRRDGKSIDSQGAYVNNDTGGSYSPTIPIEVGKRYRFSGVSGSNGSTRKRIIAYSTIEVYTYYMSGNPVEVTDPGLGEPYTAVIDLSDPMYADAKYIRLSFDTADTDVQLAEDVATQTASVPMLLSVGDYKDEAELISGLLTHKVGIRILTGEETGWALSDSGTTHRFRGTKPSDCHTPASRAPSVCTHFKYVSTGSAVGGMFIGASQYWYFIPTDQTIDTVDEWTDWLAAQYAAGTPVIVIYPLATETTEQTTAQHLTMSSNSEVGIVANVSGIETEIGHSEHPTPSPEYPLPLFCNNGELVAENGQVVAKGEDEVLYIKPGLDIELLPDAFEQGSINSYGQNDTNVRAIRLSGFINVIGGTEYVIASRWIDAVSSAEIKVGRACYYDDNETFISAVTLDKFRGYKVTVPSNCTKVRFFFQTSGFGSSLSVSDLVSVRFYEVKQSSSPAGKNLFNRCSGDFGKYLGSDGRQSDSDASLTSDYILVYGQAVYRFSAISGEHNRSSKPNNKRVVFYNASKTKIGDVIAEAVDNANTPYAITFQTPSGAVYVRLSLNIADYDVMLKIGSEEIDYEPYIDTSWQTASVPMLLSVGDTKDEVELIAGTHPHRCATCVYDGTQDVGDTYLSTTGGKDIGAIIVYPLATPDTEQITPQALSANEGMNIVEARSNVSPVELEATYKKSRH